MSFSPFNCYGSSKIQCEENIPLMIVIDPERKSRMEPCTSITNPVCGCDSKTYGNSCAADLAGLKSWTPGACKVRKGDQFDRLSNIILLLLNLAKIPCWLHCKPRKSLRYVMKATGAALLPLRGEKASCCPLGPSMTCPLRLLLGGIPFRNVTAIIYPFSSFTSWYRLTIFSVRKN